MKSIFFAATIAVFVSSCSQPKKDLATIEIGMTKTEVSSVVGEPKKKNVINKTEVWDYPDSGRTVVFRKDTVYSIMTSPKARLDSMNVWMDSTNTKVKTELRKVGDKLENAGEKIKSKIKRDSTN